MEINELNSRADDLLNKIQELEQLNKTAVQTRTKLNKSIAQYESKMEQDGRELDITTNAIEILRRVSDETVQKSYTFMAENINNVLAKLFSETERKIKLVESTRGTHPQLEIELYVEGGIKRSLKDDSGHGIMQIISLLSNLCLIVINGSRRVFVLDETLSGLSAKSRKIIDTILWTFADIGFQFIICEHGYIPKGAHVYSFAVRGKTSSVVDDYIADSGTYLNLEDKESAESAS